MILILALCGNLFGILIWHDRHDEWRWCTPSIKEEVTYYREPPTWKLGEERVWFRDARSGTVLYSRMSDLAAWDDAWVSGRATMEITNNAAPSIRLKSWDKVRVDEYSADPRRPYFRLTLLEPSGYRDERHRGFSGWTTWATK